MKKIVRNRLVPRSFLVSAIAIANATTLMTTTETTVKSAVYQNECWNTVS